MEKNSVLVVEDNELNMKLVRNLLQIANYEVLEATNAREGIEIAREKKPDLILMDIQLQGMDGLSATRIIKEDPEMKDMKVVALTAHAMQGDEGTARESGCIGHITKPIDTRNFLDAVQKYLEGASTTEKAREEPDTRGRNTVLIVDDQPLNIKLLTVKLSSMTGEELRLISATSGKEALKKATSESPDLILLDVMMPEMNGYEVTRRLKADPATRDIPVILVTALDGSEDKAKGMEAGAEEFINKPVNTAELLTRVRSMLQLRRYKEQLKMHSEAKGSIVSVEEKEDEKVSLPMVLIVEDDLKDAKLLQENLKGQPYDVMVALNGEEAISKAHQNSVDLILLDVLLPGVNGFEVCRRLKANDQTRNIQVVLVTCLGDIESKLKGVELGADDYLIKPIDGRELRARVDTLMRKKRYLDKIYSNYKTALSSAVNDGLTGIYNNPYFKCFLDLEIKRSLRKGYPGALIMIDVDDFKKYNDTLGHWVGDIILRELAQVMKASVREIDIVARYGGEEFAVVLPYCHGEGALLVAERIKEAILGHSFPNEVSQLPGKITVSMGIALYPSDGSTLEELIKRADRRLYKAKEEGKNKICVHEEASQ